MMLTVTLSQDEAQKQADCAQGAGTVLFATHIPYGMDAVMSCSEFCLVLFCFP